MPFTASHVAAVLPLVRTPLVASALVIGSMSPDIPYYLPVPVGADTTHSPVGVVGVDVLLGMGVFLIWHGLLVRPALASAPAALRGRIPAQVVLNLRARLSAPRRLMQVFLSLSLGALTHIVWDTFTHAGRWGTTHAAWLADQQGVLSGYRWAEYGSGLLGGLAVALWLARWWRSTEATSSVSGLRPAVAVRAWLLVLGAGIAGAALGSLGPLTSPEGPDLRRAAIFAVTRGIASAGLVACLLAASWHLFRGRQTTDAGDIAG